MIAAIPERRATTEAALAELERARGAAALDGQSFDAARIAECRGELEALDAAEVEAARRDREAAAQAHAVQVAATRKELKVSLDAYMAAVAAAEQHAKAMAENLALMDAHAADMRRQCRAIGARIPGSIDPHDVKAKHSAALATVLRSVGGMSNYGCVRWNSSPPITDWKGHAALFVAAAIQPLTEGA